MAADPAKVKVLRERTAWQTVERICNSVAAELLMPREDFLATLSSTGFSQVGLRLLYDRYLTSYASLLVRFKVIGGAAIVLWRRGVRPSDSGETYRVTRCFRGDDGPWLPNGISSRYLEPDIVRTAGGGGYPQLIKVLAQGLGPSVLGVAVATPPFRDGSENQRPLFNGFAIPDESNPGFEVVLLLAWEGGLGASLLAKGSPK
jgi:hypothetical protein